MSRSSFHHQSLIFKRSSLSILVAAFCGGAGQAVAAEADTLEQIDVISTTPLHGVAIEAWKIPGNVNIANDEQLDRSHTLDVSEYLNKNVGSVFVNEATTNPLQPDLQYRGFVASPLMGLPQGLSVYVDGVRINEPFGDTVNWSVIPDSAIASINLMPGSNPLFGLNTLGGALSVQTKNGFDDAGTELELSGGSFGRMNTSVSTGGSSGNVSYFLTGSWFEEDGWRDYSPSEMGQVFGNVGWRSDRATLDLSMALSDSDLIGNGALPEELLEEDRDAIFTRPDQTEQDSSLFRLGGTLAMTDNILMEGAIYNRSSDMDTFNGDDSDFEECDDQEGVICLEGEDEPSRDQFGNVIQEDDDLEGGTINRSATRQDSTGATLQFAFLNDLAGKQNQFIVGAAIDDSDVNFRSSTELGSLDETRQAIGSGVLVQDAFVHLKTNTKNQSVFLTNTWNANDKTAITVSGRYNKTEIELRDQLGTALNGDHEYDRFNPATGVSFSASDSLNLYANYSESSRAPSPMELTCADPEDPCRLPNAFLSDPPLEQVVAKTVEVGARGRKNGVNWNAALFHTINDDDIQFISAGAVTNRGYFKNIGETRRQGLELGFNGQAAENRMNWFVNYSYLDATFNDDFTVASPNHPEAEDGEISVSSGDRLPGLPEHALKAGVSYKVSSKFTLGSDLQYTSDLVLRGDESNQDEEIDGYTVVNLTADYQITDQLSFFARINNLFDAEYETFGLYGEADEVLGEEEEGEDDDDDDDEEEEGSRFLSPGAPIAGWIGLKYVF